MSLFGIGRRYYRPYRRFNGYRFRYRVKRGLLRHTAYGLRYRKYLIKKGY